jgi:hypothetical protein
METPLVEYAHSEYANCKILEPRVRLTPQPGAAARLNVLLPHYSASMMYGGIASALELVRTLSVGYDRVRFVSERPWSMTEDPADLRAFVAHPESAEIETADLFSEEGLPCHQREIFFCTFWTTALAWEAYSAALTASGYSPNPFFLFIQDYEPGFYPQNYNHCRALSAYAHGPHTHAIFNSSELASYFRGQGFSFARETVLAPSLHPELRVYLKQRHFTLLAKPEDHIVLLIYGRPAQPRNCFPVLLEGLHRFLAPMNEQERREFLIISAGASTPHPDILLCPDTMVKSAGKLPIEKYIAYLSFAHIGISLMASPHPSYPPLEMATFGLYTITNRFANKDLSQTHPLIHSIDQPWPASIAAELRNAVTWIRAERAHAGARRAILPTNMSPLPWRENVASLKLEALAPENE